MSNSNPVLGNYEDEKAGDAVGQALVQYSIEGNRQAG